MLRREQEISSALKKHPPPLFCHRGGRVTKQQTPSQRTGNPFLRFDSLHLLWSGSFSGYPLRSHRIMGSPNNFKPPPHACVWGISVDSAKQISGLSLCEPRPPPRFSNSTFWGRIFTNVHIPRHSLPSTWLLPFQERCHFIWLWVWVRNPGLNTVPSYALLLGYIFCSAPSR